MAISLKRGKVEENKEEIAKKISPKAIGNETANIVQYPNIRVAENLLQLRNNKRAIPQKNI